MTLLHMHSPKNPYALLFRPPPAHKESLAGYILRLAEANCLRTGREVLSLLSQASQDIGQASLIPQFSIYSLQFLSDGLGYPIELFHNKVLPLDVRVGSRRRFTFSGSKWPLDLLRYKTRAWCPLCLAENGFHDTQWDWRIVTCCPQHQVLLMEECPNCRQPVYWRNSQLNFCACGCHLCSAHAAPVDSVSNMGRIESLKKIEILRWLTLMLFEIDDGQHNLSSKILPANALPALHRAITTITPGALQDSKNFQQAMLARIEQRYKHYSTLGPRFAAYPLMKGLSIDETFDNDLKAIATEWLARQSLLIHKDTSRSTRHTLYSIPIKIVAHTLNVSEHIVHSLAKKQILELATGNNNLCNTKNKQINPNSLTKLLSSLSNITPIMSPEKIIRFDLLSGESAKHLHLLQDIASGTIRITAFDIRIGFPSLEILAPTPRDDDSLTVNVKKAATLLGIYVSVIYRIIAAGFLPCQRTRKKQMRVRISDIEKFKLNYVFAKELSLKFQCNSTNLTDKLIWAGVQPVHGPMIDGGIIYVFRRADVEKLDLAKVLHSKGYKSRCGRGHFLTKIHTDPNILSSSQARVLLNINSQQFAKLHHIGILKAISGYEASGELFFHKSELTAYLSEFPQNPALISLEKAKKTIGLSNRVFIERTIKTGLIDIISDGLRKYCLKKQLDAAIEYLSRVVTAQQLSKITGVNIVRIREEARDGCLAGKRLFAGKNYHGLLFHIDSVAAIKEHVKPKKMGHPPQDQ